MVSGIYTTSHLDKHDEVDELPVGGGPAEETVRYEDASKHLQ